VRYWQRALQGPVGTLAIGPHVRSARTEMAAVAAQVLTLLQPESRDVPTLQQLLGRLVAAPPASPE
jgi:hypothetical protein